MKSVLFAAGAVLLSISTTVFAFPTPASFTSNDLFARGEAEGFVAPQHLEAYCKATLKDHCPAGSCGHWSKTGKACYCAADQKPDIAATNTTAEILIQRLIAQPVKLPTHISASDWVAIQASLALLHNFVNSQSELHLMCVGKLDLQAFGFKKEIFNRLCRPEIVAPVAKQEVEKAQSKVFSIIFVENTLQENRGDWKASCDQVKRSGDLPVKSALDNQWVIDTMCLGGTKTS